MTSPSSSPGTRRTAAVYGISLGLLVIGTVLALTAGEVPVEPAFFFPAVLLVPLYLAALRRTLDFEFRKDSISVALSQLPLTLGILLVSPGAHLLARAVSSLLDSLLWRRQGAVKTTFNLGVSAFEVGIAAAAVSSVGRMEEPGPALWVALYAGLLVGDLLGNLALQSVLRILGVRRTLGQVLHPLSVAAVTSTVFTGVAIIAVSAAWTDSWTILVTLVLAAILVVAYRGYRRQSAREQSTDRLYRFVKRLGPVDVDRPEALDVLEHVRELLHARFLDLAVCDRPGGGWRHFSVRDADDPGDGAAEALALAERVAVTGAPSLTGRSRSGDSSRMSTPLMGSQGMFGVLTAQDRLGTVRAFDMGDLRLLETIGAELSTALERGRLHADLERAATRDPLTGLRNLRDVTDRLDELLAADPDAGVVLAAVAVDSFREVNDTLGHEVGDELLVEVTRRLLEASPDALVGRIGGGRFAVAVPADSAGGDPEMFGLGLRAAVEGSAQIGPVGTHVRLSVGVVLGPEHGSDAATLIRRAETAMYSARHANGGPVLWEPAYEVKGQRRLAVVTALREALAAGALGVAFQPKLETTTGRVTGVEALARWTHPALGPVGPDEFIPLAEASGLMGPLTTTVLRQSLTACKGWQRRNGGVGVAVNVSADTVLDPSFVTEVADLLSSIGVPAELLTLELTEGIVVSDPQLAAVRMGELRALGIKLSVDDFGTGYSSLTYLKGLPVDEVKIDKGFVSGLADDPADRAVVRAVVDIAHTLGLRVVAEGVEQEDQQGILRALGVDEVQGYLHARPMPALDVAAWLRARGARSHA